MEVNDNAGNQIPRGALRFFASKLAPTGLALVQPPRQLVPPTESPPPLTSIRHDSLWERACSGRRSDDGEFTGVDL